MVFGLSWCFLGSPDGFLGSPDGFWGSLDVFLGSSVGFWDLLMFFGLS